MNNTGYYLVNTGVSQTSVYSCTLLPTSIQPRLCGLVVHQDHVNFNLMIQFRIVRIPYPKQHPQVHWPST